MDSAVVVARACHDQVDLAFEPSMRGTSEMLALETAVNDAVQAAVGAAFESAGGAAFFRRTGLERLLRDARAGHFHPLPKKAQRELTGRLGLGLDPIVP